MTIKPILDIDIDPKGKLGDFLKKWQSFFEDVKQVPAAFDDAAVSANKIDFGNLGAGLVGVVDLAKAFREENERIVEQGRRSREYWSAVGSEFKGIVSSVTTIGSRLLKWGGIGAAGILGLGGAGLFGLDALAQSASARRRSAMGLGVSAGEQQAFGLEFSRFVDPDSVLGNVNAALTDIQKRSNLIRAGLSQQELAGDTASVAVSLLRHAADIAQKTPTQFLGQAAQIYGLSELGIDVEELRRLKQRPGELNDLIRQYETERKTLGLQDSVLEHWQDFDKALKSSKNVIETALIEGLHPLIPTLGRLSTAAAGVITAFLKSPEVKKELEALATYLGSPDFKTDIKGFIVDVKNLSIAVSDALKTLGKQTFRETAVHAAVGFVAGGPAGAVAFGTAGYIKGQREDYAADPKGNYNRLFDADPNRPFRWYDPGSWLSRRGGFGSLETNIDIRRMGWDADTAAALQGNAMWESGEDPTKVGDKGTSYGLFQWHGARLAALKKFEREHGVTIEGAYDERLTQLAFMNWELTKGPYKKVGDELRRATTLAEKVRIIEREYENPANPDASLARRIVAAMKTKQHAAVAVTIHDRTGGNISVNATQLPR